MIVSYWVLAGVVAALTIGSVVGFWLGLLAGESAAYYHLYGESLTEEPNGEALDGPRR